MSIFIFNFVILDYCKKKQFMIIDNLSNAGRYRALHPLFEKAFDYLRGIDTGALSSGEISIDGERLKTTVAESKMRTKQEARLETHRKFIDIQVPVSKKETFGWKSTGELLAPVKVFDDAGDIGFYHDEPTAYISAQPGEFVVFFPEDAHAPLIGEGEILKIVLKIAVA